MSNAKFYSAMTVVSLCYLAVVFPFFSAPLSYLNNDNGIAHLPNFVYMANVIKHYWQIPVWYPWEGGVPVGALSISLFPFLPHRWIGYLTYIAVPMSPMVLYKVMLLFGIAVVAAGWALFLSQITHRRAAVVIGTLLFLLSGAGVTAFHQEQIIASMMWVVWTLAFGAMALRESRYLVPAAITTGLGLTTHFPVIFLIFLICVFPVALYVGWSRWKHTLVGRPWLAIAGAVGLFAAAAPAFYMIQVMPEFASPMRESKDVGSDSLEDYLRVNRLEIASAPAPYLQNLILPKYWSDIPAAGQFSFFFPTAGWLLIVAGLILSFRTAAPVAGLSLIFCWLASGIHLGAAQLLFQAHFPFVGLFRQWLHFFPCIQMCLSLAATIGAAAVLDRWSQAKPMLARIILLAVAAVSLVHSYAFFHRFYVPIARLKAEPTVPRMERAEFSHYLRDRWGKGKYQVFRYPSHLQYKALSLWIAGCENGAPLPIGEPFPLMGSTEVGSYFCRDENYFKPHEASIQDGRSVLKSLYDDSYAIDGRGISLAKKFESESLAVFPVAERIKPEITLNGLPQKVIPILGGAMVGAWIPASPAVQSIRLSIPDDMFTYMNWLQLGLIVLCIGYLLRRPST